MELEPLAEGDSVDMVAIIYSMLEFHLNNSEKLDKDEQGETIPLFGTICPPKKTKDKEQ